MTRLVRPASVSRFTSLLLSYLLALTLYAPFTLRRVAAAIPDKATPDSSGKKAPASLPAKAQANDKKAKRRDSELLVRFRQNASAADVDALLQANGARHGMKLRGQSGIERLRLLPNSDPDVVATNLRSSSLVDLVEPNYLITADQSAPDDPRFSEQWALKNSGQNSGYLGSDIGAEGAWNVTAGSPKTVVAVIDSGVDFTHPDLKNNEWNNSLEKNDNRDDDQNGFTDDLHGWNFVTDSAEIKDEYGHGTAVAGIIAAEGNNRSGITGVMWKASLMSLRVLDQTGTGDVAAAVEAIDYASENGAQVINCSWGTDSYSAALFEATQRASKRGVIVVTSAGNASTDIETTPHYPASFDLLNVISVAATDNLDLLVQSSNWGTRHIAIAAPGKDILTMKIGGDYQTISGTSAAAPFVTGVVGLLKSLRPWLDVSRTREMVVSGARRVDALSDKVSSKGVVSASGALETLRTTVAPGEGMDEAGGNNGGEHGNNGKGRVAPGSAPSAVDPRHGNPFSVTPPARIQGAPRTGLPNLEDLRRTQPVTPQAPAPIPSTKCSHKVPDCDKDKEKHERKASIQAPTGLLAWSPGIPAVDSLLNIASGQVSDSPFSIYLSANAKTKADNTASTQGSAGTLTRLVPLAGWLMMAPPPPIISYNAVADFSVTQNPTGPWSYGYKPLSSSTFYAFASNNNLYGPGIETWSQGYCCPPLVSRNSTGQTYTYPAVPSVTHDPDVLVVHPGGSGERGVVRWTAPASGTFTIEGKFKGQDTGSTTKDVSILHNSTTIYSGNINGYGNQVTFSITRTVTTGDTIDFQVGYGSNGTYYSDSTGLAATISQSSGTAENVIWTNVVGVTPSGNSLTKNTAEGWGNAGAVSTQSITSGDAYVEFTALENNTYRMLGLSNGDSNQSYTDIDFALYPALDGYVYIYQAGNYVGQFGAYSPGDRFRVAVEGGQVKYYRVTGGAVSLIYTSGVAPTYPLLVDTAFYTAGATISNVVINRSATNPTAMWTNIVGVTPSGNSLSKPGTDGWNAGAVSVQSITSGDGYVESTAQETGTYRMFGLSNDDSNQSYTDIDYACYLVAGGVVQVYEGGAYRGQFTSYTTGDQLRVAVEGGVVRYSKNGSVFYTSTVTPTYPLLVDTSLYSTGATISNVVISGTGATSGFSAERVDPYNRTGSGGVDLLSGNVNWSLPIVGLQGRAGLDLGLSLSYNSLVWTKSQDGTSVKFDADQGMPSPGFRLGFPVIQPRYYNAQVGANAYLLITSSGGHVELRQTATPNVYESADSSYLQLIDNNGSLTLRPTDGSQLTYLFINGQYQCVEIKDRNGNFITISYYVDGRIYTVKDTLSRVLTFNYDGYLNLQSITQTWGGTAHTWATFGWGTPLTISTSFSGPTVAGPQNGSTIPVLRQVGFADGSRYNFDYNGYAQVTVVRHYAYDNHQRAYTSYTLPASTSDCPRATEEREWAEMWNGDIDGLPATNEEAVTAYAVASVTGDHSVGQVTTPDGTIYKEIYMTSGWPKGLTVGTEFWSGGVRKKWTDAYYTQDDNNLSYAKNPRLIETNIYDAEGNRRRTTIDYGPGSGPGNGQYARWGLPYYVTEYASDGATLLRRTYTDYNLDQAYIDRHIIGLVSAVHMMDGYSWLSKTGYEYDAGGDQLQATSAAATQHDASYNTGMTARGNLTLVSHYDVYDIGNEAKKLVTRMGYDTDGSVIFTRDHLSHQGNISYTDSFSDSINRNTFAYPTTVTDADGYSSTVQYNYDFGATTRTQTPAPADQTQGAIQSFEYDAAGRVSAINNLINNSVYSYKHLVYHPGGAVLAYTTIRDSSTEAYSVTTFDGAGRVRGTAADNPNSTGSYSGQLTEYDVMGRVFKQYNPTEMNGSWVASGDDAAGWVATQQAYDWKGRPTQTTNVDGTTKLITYGGCGCAGGEVVTVRDEAGRQQRVTADVLGRTWKTEVLDYNGNVYSTVTNTYNVRGQITSTVELAISSGATQTTTLTYDGYGRLKTQQAPEQTAATQYNYNTDDTVHDVTDGRGVITTFAYNNRHMVTNVSYTTVSGVPATAAVTYGYDAAGNRTSMTDGMGSVSYSYDQLSRLTSETRTISALSRSYTLSYEYTLAGTLKKLTDPFGSEIYYGYDSTGRVTGITGSAYGGVNTYVSNIGYRAWGAVKGASFGDSSSQTTTYDSMLRPRQFRLTSGSANLMREDFAFYADGRLHTLTDMDDTAGSNPPTTLRFMSRSYSYDHMGRVTYSGGSPTPYQQSYGYDAFSNLTSRSGSYNWETSQSDTTTYVNNRRTGWTYDADERLSNSPANSSSPGTTWQYDAAGLLTGLTDIAGSSTTTGANGYDGDGQLLYNYMNTYNPYSTPTTITNSSYVIRSSVLKGEIVTKLDASGNKDMTYVPTDGLVAPIQTKDYYGQPSVSWKHRDPVGVTETGPIAYDPLGNSVVLQQHPPAPQPPQFYFGTNAMGWPYQWGGANNYSTGCTLDGAKADCNNVLRGINSSGTVNLTGLSTTGGWADFANAGLGDLVNSIRQGYISSDGRYALFTSVKLRQRADGSYQAIRYNGHILDVTWTAATFFVPGNQANTAPNVQNATSEQQNRFNDAYAQLMSSLSANNGDNPCAKLFGGYEKAVKALKETHFSFQALGAPLTDPPPNDFVHAVTDGKNIVINSQGGFMANNGQVPTVLALLPGSDRPNERAFVTRTLMATDSPGKYEQVDFQNDVKFTAFVLAHELGHRRGIYGKDDKDGLDDKNGTPLDNCSSRFLRVSD